MIRVNLLPQKKAPLRGKPQLPSASGSKWLLVLLGVVLLEVVGLIVFHSFKNSDLDKYKAKNKELQGQIANIQQLVNQHDAVKKELEELRAREEAIAKLQGARTGPANFMLELSQILTPGRAPTVDPDRQRKLQEDNQYFNATWDGRRLWLAKYTEKSRTVVIDGFARDSNDVSELGYRLRASSYVYDVKLLSGKKEEKGDADMVGFGIEMKVRY